MFEKCPFSSQNPTKF